MKQMGLLPLVLLLTVLVIAATPPTDPAGSRIVGEWRGTSLCTNLEIAPACKDESVRYFFTGPAAGTNTYHLVADKMVSGEYATMGEFDLEYASADSTWSRELEDRRGMHFTWWYRIDHSILRGGAVTASGDSLRRVSAKRVTE